jgi:aryl-alcohol dehydrogenase-like predicted oxidoreductase
VFICTKFVVIRGPNGEIEIRDDREYVRQACEKSLEKLGIDCIINWLQLFSYLKFSISSLR